MIEKFPSSDHIFQYEYISNIRNIPKLVHSLPPASLQCNKWNQIGRFTHLNCSPTRTQKPSVDFTLQEKMKDLNGLIQKKSNEGKDYPKLA